MSIQCRSYDFTIPKVDDDEALVRNFVIGCASKWVYQLEKSDTGYVHYQGRVSLIKKRREDEVKSILRHPGIHWSLTSSINSQSFSYVMKIDTRIDGPWSDKDPALPYVPRQIREFASYEMYPWQRDVAAWCEVWDKRSIHVIYDSCGNSGKSNLRMYLSCMGKARSLPFCNDFKDILRNVMDMPLATAYFVDMPRAVTKDKLYQFWGAIESIKDGYCYDDRYSFKERYFDSPQIFVMTNSLPDSSLMSRDRWKIWYLIEDKTLILKEID